MRLPPRLIHLPTSQLTLNAILGSFQSSLLSCRGDEQHIYARQGRVVRLLPNFTHRITVGIGVSVDQNCHRHHPALYINHGPHGDRDTGIIRRTHLAGPAVTTRPSVSRSICLHRLVWQRLAIHTHQLGRNSYPKRTRCGPNGNYAYHNSAARAFLYPR